jgi:small subunit ribosomal protein S8
MRHGFYKRAQERSSQVPAEGGRTGDQGDTMSVSDPVSDLLARLRNAISSRHAKLDVPASKLKLEIARILKEEGYISNYKATEENSKRFLRVYLKYDTNNQAAIRGLSRISHPGCRVYVHRDEIRRVQGGLGISIITTPKGVMTGRQARREGVGGELLCEVW